MLLSIEMSLFFVIKSSQFFYLVTDVMFAIFNGYIFVNGAVVVRLFMQTYAGDCVCLAMRSQFFLYTKKFCNDIMNLRYSRLLSTLKFFSNEKKLQRLNCSKANVLSFDIANYMEVDFLVGSIFVLYSPFFLSEVNSQPLAQHPVFAMRLYN